MGRQVNIPRKKKENSRCESAKPVQQMFRKRSGSLHKKAEELAVKTGAYVALITIFGENCSSFRASVKEPWSPSVKAIMQRYTRGRHKTLSRPYIDCAQAAPVDPSLDFESLNSHRQAEEEDTIMVEGDTEEDGMSDLDDRHSLVNWEDASIAAVDFLSNEEGTAPTAAQVVADSNKAHFPLRSPLHMKDSQATTASIEHRAQPIGLNNAQSQRTLQTDLEDPSILLQDYNDKSPTVGAALNRGSNEYEGQAFQDTASENCWTQLPQCTLGPGQGVTSGDRICQKECMMYQDWDREMVQVVQWKVLPTNHQIDLLRSWTNIFGPKRKGLRRTGGHRGLALHPGYR